MASIIVKFFILALLFISCLASDRKPKPYIVYMGGTSSNDNQATTAEAEEFSHMKLLSSVVSSEEKEKRTVFHSYHHGFKGFSALLSDDEAFMLSGHDGVVSVFPDQHYELHTTRSWDFLEGGANLMRSTSHHLYGKKSKDVIIGVIDTGMYAETGHITLMRCPL